jgi:hypothetical protein
LLAFFVSLVQKAANAFFKEIRFNDPDCDTLNKAKERLSEQDKQG